MLMFALHQLYGVNGCPYRHSPKLHKTSFTSSQNKSNVSNGFINANDKSIEQFLYKIVPITTWKRIHEEFKSK